MLHGHHAHQPLQFNIPADTLCSLGQGLKLLQVSMLRNVNSSPPCRVESHAVAKRRGDTLRKAAGRMANLKVAAAWASWQELVGGGLPALPACMSRCHQAVYSVFFWQSLYLLIDDSCVFNGGIPDPIW
jgi:hypothetical protein